MRKCRDSAARLEKVIAGVGQGLEFNAFSRRDRAGVSQVVVAVIIIIVIIIAAVAAYELSTSSHVSSTSSTFTSSSSTTSSLSTSSSTASSSSSSSSSSTASPTSSSSSSSSSSSNSLTSTSTSPTTNSSDVVNVALSDGGISVDPVVAPTDLTSFTLASNVYQGLVGFGTSVLPSGQTIYNASKPVPELAQSWNQSSDGKTWTFILRSGVTFSNGDPFDAQAVAYTINRTLTMGFAGAFFLGLAGISSNSTKVINDTAVQFTVKPGPFLLQGLQYMLIVDPAFVQANGGVVAGQTNAYLTTHAMGTGPFVLQSYNQSTGAVLMANARYWGTPPRAGEIDIKVVPNATAREQMLQTDAVQFINDIPPTDVSALNGTSGAMVLDNPGNGELYLDMNFNTRPFNDLHIREAIAYAIPYDAILQQVGQGYATQLRSFVPSGAFGYNNSWPYTQDQTEAELLLQEGLKEGGYTIATLPPITLTIDSGSADQQIVASIIVQSLKAIGLTVDVQSLPTATFLSQLTAGTLQFYMTKLNPAINDVRYVAYGFFYSKGFANFDHLNSSSIDTLATEIYFGPSSSSLFTTFQEQVASFPAWIYLYQYPDLVATNSHLQGFQVLRS